MRIPHSHIAVDLGEASLQGLSLCSCLTEGVRSADVFLRVRVLARVVRVKVRHLDVWLSCFGLFFTFLFALLLPLIPICAQNFPTFCNIVLMFIFCSPHNNKNQF